MKAQEFFELTGKVRAAQKLFYKSRLRGDLVAAKGLEAQLDKALKEGLDFEPTATLEVTDGDGVYRGEQIGMFMDDDDPNNGVILENGDGNEENHD